MSAIFDEPDGATPLTAEEKRDLIPSHISCRRELNEAEAENIARAHAWSLGRRHRDLLSEAYIKGLHRRMFGDVWRWAGKFRLSERNMGVEYWLIPVEIRQLIDECRGWIELSSYPPDEIAVRLHHRLTVVHPFPYGNGRHARLMADLLVMQLGRERFSWGRASLRDAGMTRAHYVEALRAADRLRIGPLIGFARA